MIFLKFVVRPFHLINLGGYIVERNFPYRDIIVVNKTDEPIKIEVPVFEESWIQEHKDLGLEIIKVKEEDNFLKLFKRAQADLKKISN